MNYHFKQVFEKYQKDSEKKTECQPGDADFDRWFISSKDDLIYILSYYCRTKVSRGYEHLKVRLRGSDIEVLDFQTSLKGFGLTDAGDYCMNKTGEEALKIQTEVLQKVKPQLRQQKNPFNQAMEICPDPRTQTLHEAQTKIQNGLHYYRIAISCNYTGSGFDFMTHIEVVEDKKCKKLNDGKPLLVVVDTPEMNTEFLREKEQEIIAMQGDSSTKHCPLIALIFQPLVIKFLNSGIIYQ